jgi:hypothetical protein
MTLLGLACHFLKTLKSLRENGDTHVTPTRLFRDHPYSTALSITSAVAATFILIDLDQMTMAAAFGTGYFADSVADFMRPRIQKRYGG